MADASDPHEEELIAFVETMDRCWLERRFDDLNAYLANDIVLGAPNGAELVGAEAAIESYRAFMSRSTVDLFDAFDWEVTVRGEAATVRYAWRMRWTSEGKTHDETGREALVLSKRPEGWRVVSRTQMA
jgi:ketosteroid isomerase-like protein